MDVKNQTPGLKGRSRGFSNTRFSSSKAVLCSETLQGIIVKGWIGSRVCKG